MVLIDLHPYISGFCGLRQGPECTLWCKSDNDTLVLTEPVRAITKYVAMNCPRVEQRKPVRHDFCCLIVSLFNHLFKDEMSGKKL